MADVPAEMPNRKRASSSSIVYGILIVACIGWFCYYMGTPVEPFAYYKDLGFDHQVTDWAIHTVHSPIDFFDTLAWAPWNGTKLFYLSSYATLLVTAPLAAIVGNAWLAVKIVQSLQTIVAALGAYALYSTIRRSPRWSLSFALLYAASPMTMLAVRGNVELGWIAALLPGILALGKLLVRRFGSRAIPIVGLLCSIPFILAIEYLLFASLPLFALVVLSEREALRRRRDWLYVAVGLVACVAVGAFFLFPTFVNPLFTDAAVRTKVLISGAFLDNFSENWLGLFALVPRESIASPISEFNANDAIPILIFPALLWWPFALAFLRFDRSRAAFSDGPCLTVGIACVVLALGTTLPFGKPLWNFLFLIPHLDAIRTPDRFLSIPGLLVLLWFVLELELSTSRFRMRSSRAVYAVLCATIAEIAFAVSQHCFAVDPSIGTRMPQFNAVADTVATIGGRTASFAGVNGGSIDDSADYGSAAPISAAYLDLGGRFLQDGLGAVGVLSRIGVRSVITSPNWTYDGADDPISANVYRHVLTAETVFTSPEDVRVARIPGRDPISEVTAFCSTAGSAALDALFADPLTSNVSFVAPQSSCTRWAYVDFDPLDLWRTAHPLDAWAGTKLVPTAYPVRDHDYPFLPNRVLVNVAQYRNAIDGDYPSFDLGGAANIGGDASIAIASHRLWPRGSTVAIRFVSHAGGIVRLTSGSDSRDATFTGADGFRWMTFVLGRDVGPDEPVRLTIETRAPDDGETTDPVTALDGVVVLAERPRPVSASNSFSVATIRRFEYAGERVPSTNSSDAFEIAGLEGAHLDSVGMQPAIVADRMAARARYRWAGAAGTYVVEADGNLESENATMTIEAANVRCCGASARVDPNDESRHVRALEQFNLHPGSLIDVRLSLPHMTPSSADRIVEIAARRLSPLRLLAGKQPEAALDFGKPLEAFGHITETKALSVSGGEIAGSAGSSLTFTVSAERPVERISISVDRFGDGLGSTLVSCDGHESKSVLSPTAATAQVIGTRLSHCTVHIVWDTGTFAIARISVSPELDQGAARFGRVWTDAGSYVFDVVATDGRLLPTSVRITGCTQRRCSFSRAGFRSIALDRPNGDEGLILFRPSRTSTSQRSLTVRADSALRSTLNLKAPSDLEVTQIYDGHWILDAPDGAHERGERCDIINTCYVHVPPGTYELYHEWPMESIFGVAVSIGTLIGASVLMVFPRKRRAV